MSEKLNHNRTYRINSYVRKHLAVRKCLSGPDVRKFSSAKISTFTVFIDPILYFTCLIKVVKW